LNLKAVDAQTPSSPPEPPLLRTPERVPACFAAALNAGQLQQATSCFTRDACLISPGATAIHGREEIRGLLAQMIDRASRIDIQLSTVVRAGDVAYAHQRWTLSSAAAEGERYTQVLGPILVLRRLETQWKLAIAMPWG
jgi:ketosteroid isomerase-like protein